MPEHFECTNCFHIGPLNIHGGCECCGSQLVISQAFNDSYVIHAAGFWLRLWQRNRRALWRGCSAWGKTHQKVEPCLKKAENSPCSAAAGTE